MTTEHHRPDDTLRADTRHDGAPEPGELTFARLHRTVAEVLGTEASALGPHDDLLESGLDSLRMMRLAEFLREHGVDVALPDLAEAATVTGWWALAREASAAPEPAEGNRTDPR